MRTLALAMVFVVSACSAGPRIRPDSQMVAAYKHDVRALRQYVEEKATAWRICHETHVLCTKEANDFELASRSVGDTAFVLSPGDSQSQVTPRALPPCLQSLNLELANSGLKLWAVTRTLYDDSPGVSDPRVADAQATFETVVARIEATHC